MVSTHSNIFMKEVSCIQCQNSKMNPTCDTPCNGASNLGLWYEMDFPKTARFRKVKWCILSLLAVAKQQKKTYFGNNPKKSNDNFWHDADMINTCHGPFQIECSIWKPRIQDYEKMMSWTSSSLKPTCKSRYASTPKSHSHIKHLCNSNIQNDVAHFVADNSWNIDTIILQISLKKHLLNLSGENAMENESVMHFTERRISPGFVGQGTAKLTHSLPPSNNRKGTEKIRSEVIWWHITCRRPISN